MPLSDYSYSELPSAYNTYNTTKVSRIWRHACAFLLSVTVILTILLLIPRRNEFAPLDNFQDLHNVSVVDWTAVPPWSSNSSTAALDPNEHAVVSSLYTDTYLTAVTTLGHSLKAANVKARMILIYIPGRLSPRTLCLATAAGWTLHPVSLVKPPHNGEGIHPQYADQYTKLRIWTLDSLGIKSLVYLDADTLVRGNFDELFTLPFNFAAVPDIFTDHGFLMSFNAGVLFVRPNTAVFEDMLEKIETARFPPDMAEQSFLNVYFGSQAVRLPFTYNGNLAIKRRSPMLWKKLAADMRIVHYTLEKPFPKHGLGYRETLKKFFEGRITMQHGIWETEMGWWQASWREMSLEMQRQSKCSEYYGDNGFSA